MQRNFLRSSICCPKFKRSSPRRGITRRARTCTRRPVCRRSTRYRFIRSTTTTSKPTRARSRRSSRIYFSRHGLFTSPHALRGEVPLSEPAEGRPCACRTSARSEVRLLSPLFCGERSRGEGPPQARSLRVVAPHPNILPARGLRRRKGGEKGQTEFAAHLRPTAGLAGFLIPLDPHHLELEFGIAQPRCGVGRKRFFKRLDLGFCQRDVDRSGIFLQIFSPFGARDRDNIVAAREQPGDGNLRRRDAALFGGGLERYEQVQVLFEIAFLETRMGMAPVGGNEIVARLERAAQEPAPQRRIGHEADAEFLERRQNLLLDVAGPQRIFGLDRGERVRFVGAADRVGTRFA